MSLIKWKMLLQQHCKQNRLKNKQIIHSLNLCCTQIKVVSCSKNKKKWWPRFTSVFFAHSSCYYRTCTWTLENSKQELAFVQKVWNQTVSHNESHLAWYRRELRDIWRCIDLASNQPSRGSSPRIHPIQSFRVIQNWIDACPSCFHGALNNHTTHLYAARLHSVVFSDGFIQQEWNEWPWSITASHYSRPGIATVLNCIPEKVTLVQKCPFQPTIKGVLQILTRQKSFTPKKHGRKFLTIKGNGRRIYMLYATLQHASKRVNTSQFLR